MPQAEFMSWHWAQDSSVAFQIWPDLNPTEPIWDLQVDFTGQPYLVLVHNKVLSESISELSAKTALPGGEIINYLIFFSIQISLPSQFKSSKHFFSFNMITICPEYVETRPPQPDVLVENPFPHQHQQPMFLDFIFCTVGLSWK